MEKTATRSLETYANAIIGECKLRDYRLDSQREAFELIEKHKQVFAANFHPSFGTPVHTPQETMLFEYLCSVDSFFVDDHRIYGVPVAPAAMFFSMAVSGLKHRFPEQGVRITDAVVKHPLHVPETGEIKIQLLLHPREAETYGFQVFSAPAQTNGAPGDWVEHVSGSVARNGSGEPEPATEPEFVTRFQDRCDEVISADMFYRPLYDCGMHWGRHYQWIDTIWCGEKEVLARMRRPGAAESFPDDQVPTGLLDACTQALLACVPRTHGDAYMFLAYDHLAVYGAPAGQFWCSLKLKSGAGAGDVITGEFVLFDDQGRAVAASEGFHAVRVPREKLLKTIDTFPRHLHHELVWEDLPKQRAESPAPGEPEAAAGQFWTVITDSRGLGDTLATALEEQGHTCVRIRAGEGFEKTGRLEFRIDPLAPKDYETLSAHLAEISSVWRGVLHCLGLDAIRPDGSAADFSGTAVKRITGSALLAARHLADPAEVAPPRFWMVTDRAQSTGHRDHPVGITAAPLWGMGSVMAQELGESFGGILDLDGTVPGLAVRELVSPRHRPRERCMAFRGETVRVPRLVQREPVSPAQKSFTLDPEATYLITGGPGGLGIHLTRWLVRRGAVHVAWLSRNGGDEAARDAVAELTATGARIRSYLGDVAEQASLTGILERIRKESPPLKGVFHLAGVVDDGMLFQQDPDRMMAAMTPKVTGTWLLHRLTRKMDLDHFVLFSSVASVLGSPGQVSYAAGNAFLDAMAGYRDGRGLPALTINWGPWARDGMASRMNVVHLRKWSDRGIHRIKAEMGLDALGGLLANRGGRAILCSVDWSRYVHRAPDAAKNALFSRLTSSPPEDRTTEKDPEKTGKPAPRQASPDEPAPGAPQVLDAVRDRITAFIREVMLFDADEKLNPGKPLMELGIDSLMITELRSRIKGEYRVDLPFAEFLEKTVSIESLAAVVCEKTGTCKLDDGDTDGDPLPRAVPRPDGRFAPFPLTDIQYAYWIGRSGQFELSRVACHVYAEVEIEDLDLGRLDTAVHRLVDRHDMLRAVVLPDGTQCIRKEWRGGEIAVSDLRNESPETVAARLGETRERMSHSVHPAEQGPLFEIRAALLDGRRTRLHCSFDLLIGDGFSFNILINDLYAYYRDPAADLPDLPLTFRDYVMALADLRETDLYKKSLAYWRERVRDLPPAPEIPTARHPGDLGDYRFSRMSHRIEKASWDRLKQKAARSGVTPSGLLLSAFAQVLARWSKRRRFAVMLTLFNRLPLHPRVNDIVGDFTSLIALEVDMREEKSFMDHARAIQEQLLRDMEHRYVSGVQVLRELGRVRGRESAITLPVVFTSNLTYSGAPGEEASTVGLPADLPIDFIYCVSQTPQVWLDYQIVEVDGALVYFWDVIEDLFPEGLMADMFQAMASLLDDLASGDTAREETRSVALPPGQAAQRQRIHETGRDVSGRLLHELFLEQVRNQPRGEAIVTTQERFSYEQLHARADGLVRALAPLQLRPGQVAAVVMEKGWEQVVAVLGTLFAGAAYLPIDPEVPRERLFQILGDSDARVILTQRRLSETLTWPERVHRICVDDLPPSEDPAVSPRLIQNPGDLAYVIYTSGSTGKPKGVMIDHRGAVNTILSINDQCGVGPADRVLALSNLNFDLSVYDIFGILAAGGAMVMPDARDWKEADHWVRLMDREGVTVWNSVPALMEMLVAWREAHGGGSLDRLRLVMLSGDWIPPRLPDDIRGMKNGVEILSLGGATEASIWSIGFPVTSATADWRSIPYGKPLPNQRVYVLNDQMAECPVWVPGHLFIGGVGLAMGYWRDEEKTAHSFIRHPATGERLYRTGDLGRYLPDGNIEFLGREDSQVKIRGHRIELGEIEAHLNDCPGVREGVVVAAGASRRRRLMAYVVPETDTDAALMESVTAEGLDMAALWPRIRERGLDTERTAFSKLPVPEFTTFHDDMDQYSLGIIRATLNALGAFRTAGEQWSPAALAETAGIEPGYGPHMDAWFAALADHGDLTPREDGTYVNADPMDDSFARADIFPEKPRAWKSYLAAVIDYFEAVAPRLPDLLTGKTDALRLFFADDITRSPQHLLRCLPGVAEIDAVARAILAAAGEAATPERPLRIIEVFGRSGITTRAMAPAIPGDHRSYTVTDPSVFFSNLLKTRIDPDEQVAVADLDIERDPGEQGIAAHAADVVVTGYGLHLAGNPDAALSHIRGLLAPGGLLLILESTRNSILQHVSAHLIPGGEPQDRKVPAPLPGVSQWRDALDRNRFEDVMVFPEPGSPQGIFGVHVILARAPSEILRFRSQAVRDYLEKRLPAYMLPERYEPLERIPLTSNGKVDRTALARVEIPDPGEGGEGDKGHVAPRTPLEEILADIWRQAFQQEEIGVHDNFFTMGGDSLIGTQVIAGIRGALKTDAVTLRDLFEYTTIARLGAHLQKVTAGDDPAAVKPGVPAGVTPDPDHRHEPFPLSDVQQAYWIGRLGSFELSRVATHTYFEIEGEALDVGRLETIWRQLVAHHDMMRAVILPNGMEQRILAEVPPYVIAVTDLRDEAPEVARARLADLRREMSHQVIATDTWPLFDIRASLLAGDRVRIHVSFDNIVFDGWSMLSLFNEWSRLYYDAHAGLSPLELSFRDYLLAVQGLEDTPAFRKDREYWFSRVPDLPPAPELPLAKAPAAISDHHFQRHEAVLSAGEWSRLKAAAKARQLTPSGCLLAVYAEVLAAWSKSPRFCINLTLFNRLPLHPQVSDIVGDFTSLTLLAVTGRESSFTRRARAIQRRLWRDLDHPLVGGIRVMREFMRVHRMDTRSAVMPVVFTSALGMGDMDGDAGGVTRFGDLVYSITQTPQVWLDHQVYENQGELVLIWDAVADLFPDGLLGRMFGEYCRMLRTLAGSDAPWDVEGPSLRQTRDFAPLARDNTVVSPLTEDMLHTLFMDRARQCPDALAVASKDRTLSYGELHARALGIASHLMKHLPESASPEVVRVAVVMEKGWEQIAAVLGILYAGGAYLPVDPWVPDDRLRSLLEHAAAPLALTQAEFRQRSGWPDTTAPLAVEDIDFDGPAPEIGKPRQNPDDPAYVIFTSGSTGFPKGVVMDHRAVVNTILDINRRFAVGPADRGLSLSNLNFDLSVYDIFGLLAAGGTVVVPDPAKRKDPAHWLEMLHTYRVSVWNSVPALMQVLTELAADRGRTLPESLRLVLLSGDWIPVPLPEAVRALGNDPRIVSLGGATEAAIWSICYPIGTVDPDRSSIPYGKPLTNQAFYVLNPFLEECPPWVTGQLYIGGAGLSRGYLDEPEKTEAAFIQHPRTGERLYRTGDLGRYLPDGDIEFLGREDTQVKVRGYRIELGEIEYQLQRRDDIKDAVVTVAEKGEDNRDLAAYLVPAAGRTLDLDAVRAGLAQQLPDYMLPACLTVLPALPLSPNGKVDRRALPAPSSSASRRSQTAYVAPGNETETLIAEVFREVLGIEKIGMRDNYFDLGANSLHILRIQNRLGGVLGTEIPVLRLFEYTTIARLAAYLNRETGSGDTVARGRGRAENRKARRARRGA